MSFTINEITAYPPVGSCNAYLGTDHDPSGWVICDGVERDNSTGLYNTLLSLGIGNNSSNDKYTPPDLKNRMLYGSSNVNVTQSTGGSSTVELSLNHIPSHNHSISITDPGHSHPVATTSTQRADGLSAGNQIWGPWAGNDSVVLTAQTKTTGITADAGYTGSGSSIDILPPYITVNFILKI